MRILCCLNRDLAGNVALNRLLPVFARHQVRVGLTEQVGKSAVAPGEPAARGELREAEQRLPNEIFFPLVTRANGADDGKRYLTFEEIERHRGIPVGSLPSPNSPEGLDAIRKFAPDLILTVRYGAILKAEAIAIPRLGVLNLHSGVLPAYRGVLATFRALANGDSQIGCTLHYIRDAGIDAGDIIEIARIPVDRNRSLLWHILSLYAPGVEMIRRAIDRLSEGAVPASTPQPAGEGAYYTFPTEQDWQDFAQRGWKVAEMRDLAAVFRLYTANH